jgi:dynein heavy chain, axonemal
MTTWMKQGHPSAYWLSGFFFPHGFVTGVLQAFARKHTKAIDFLKFRFNCLDLRTERRAAQKQKDEEETKKKTTKGSGQDVNDEDLISKPPVDGVYIYGLYIESGAWSEAKGCIVEQKPGVIVSPMPIVHFLPFEVKHVAIKKSYAAPAKKSAK